MKSPCLRLSKGIASLAALAIIFFLVGGCASTNHTPLITSLKVAQDTLPPLGSCQIECIASDEDGDELSYEWSAEDGNINGDGPTVTWSAPNSPGTYTITVKVTDENGDEDTIRADLTVQITNPQINHPLTITSLTASENLITSSSTCQIECVASGQEDDELSYEWAASGGHISGTGSIVNWTAPEAVGTYSITVVVTDGQGGEDTASLTISVASNRPPVIEDFVVIPKEPKYLEEYQGGYKILKGKSCKIICVASDPEDDKLSYEWISDGGSISGKGPVITWTAPQGDKVTITVTVSDSSGGTATKSIAFTVKTCTCGFQ